jgi:hypothetical protein
VYCVGGDDPLLWLRVGDRVKLMRRKGSITVETIFATVAMNGHAVEGRTFYADHPDENYINVDFDHVRYEALHPNDTIYARDDWQVFVNMHVSKRIVNERTASASVADKRTRLAEAIVRTQNELKSLQKRLDEL